MALSERELRDRARRSYEVARLRSSFGAAWFIAPMVVLSLHACNAPALTLAIGALLLAACAYASWRGTELSRAVAPGLSSGFLAALVPIIAQALGEPCSSILPGSCALSCVLGGIAAGAFLAYRARGVDQDRARFLTTAGTIAFLAGSLGCALSGIGGILGMSVGLAATAAPVLFLARSRS
jgi:hypothetical protein